MLALCAASAAALSQGDSGCGAYTTQAGCEDDSPVALGCAWAPPFYDAAASDVRVCRAPQCWDAASGPGAWDVLCAASAVPGGCTWHPDRDLCWPPSEPLPCTSNFQQATCLPPCRWDGSAFECQNATFTVCADFEESGCAAGGCQWVPFSGGGGACAQPGPVPCSLYGYQASPDGCPMSCKWVDVGPEEGVCLDDAEVLACSTYSEATATTGIAATCPSDRCQYISDLDLCWPPDRPVPCHLYVQDPCAASDVCEWRSEEAGDGGACVPCASGAGCSAPVPTTAPPPPAPPCNTFTGDELWNCPYPSCMQDFDGGCGGGRCIPATCNDLSYDPSSCAALGAPCSFDDVTQLCTNTSAPFPCDQVNAESSCPTDKGCAWYPPKQLYNTPGMVRRAHPGARAPDRSPSPDRAQCFEAAAGFPSCSQFPDGGSCRELGSGCKWDLDLWTCVSLAQTASCSSYTEAGECPTDRCQLVQGLCWDQASGRTHAPGGARAAAHPTPFDPGLGAAVQRVLRVVCVRGHRHLPVRPEHVPVQPLPRRRVPRQGGMRHVHRRGRMSHRHVHVDLRRRLRVRRGQRPGHL